MPAPMPILPEQMVPHTPWEDAQGFAIALLTASTGLLFLTHLGFLTGQTAGLALIISYVTGWSFGLVFTLVNVPFYAFAWKRLGPEFTIKSMGCVVALSLMMEVMPRFVAFEHLDPYMGVAIFGVLTGFGLLGVFRHKGSLGGLGVIALLVQDKTGFRAGYVQLIVDAILFTVAFFLFETRVVLFSLLGAVILNGVIAFNHRRDRYISG